MCAGHTRVLFRLVLLALASEAPFRAAQATFKSTMLKVGISLSAEYCRAHVWPHRFFELFTRADASIRPAALSALRKYFISPSRTGRPRRPHATHRGATRGAEEELRSDAPAAARADAPLGFAGLNSLRGSAHLRQVEARDRMLWQSGSAKTN